MTLGPKFKMVLQTVFTISLRDDFWLVASVAGNGVTVVRGTLSEARKLLPGAFELLLLLVRAAACS